MTKPRVDLEPFRDHANSYLVDDGEGSTRGERDLATDILVLLHELEEARKENS